MQLKKLHVLASVLFKITRKNLRNDMSKLLTVENWFDYNITIGTNNRINF